MKSTSKEDYIRISCNMLCANNDTCDKSHIYIQQISEKTTKIGCSSFKKKEG